MKILIKASGDIIEDQKAMALIEQIALTHQEVTLIHGMGTQFSKALDEAGIPYKFKNGSRVTNLEGLKIGLKVCEETRKKLKIPAKIISPIRWDGDQIVNVNADKIFRTLVGDYDFGIIFTKSGRKRPHLEVK